MRTNVDMCEGWEYIITGADKDATTALASVFDGRTQELFSFPHGEMIVVLNCDTWLFKLYNKYFDLGLDDELIFNFDIDFGLPRL